jgi:hypothetical protein
MAMQPDQENVFRFMVLKPATYPNISDNIYLQTEPSSGLEDYLKNPDHTGQERIDFVENYLEENNVYSQLQSFKDDLEKLIVWSQANENLALDDIELTDLDTLGIDTDSLPAFYILLSDFLIAGIVLKNVGWSAVEVTTKLKLLALVLEKYSAPLGERYSTVRRFLDRSVMMLPEYARPALSTIASHSFSKPSEKKFTPVNDTERLEQLETAYKELAHFLGNEKYRYLPAAKTPKKPAKTAATKNTTGYEFILRNAETLYEREFIVHPQYIKTSSEHTREVLKSFDTQQDEVNPNKLLPLIEKEILGLKSTTAIASSRTELVYLNNRTYIAKTGDTSGAPSISGCQLQAGVADLLIVKQKLKAYELTEIAHVENVLAGESKERVHRRLSVEEETTTDETETETEKDRDLESADRNEMQSEAEKTVQQDFRLDAGLQVSGAYGPVVKFSANANTSYSTSTQETKRQSVTFSKELTEKISEKVREKVRKERVRKLREETEETNTHKIQNENAENGHIRGVYRWLNKVYDAQVYNYGKRMMYEFLVPEPAAFYIYAKVQNQDPNAVLIKPEPPTYEGRALMPSDITLDNYYSFVSTYRITDAPPPPARTTTRSHKANQQGDAEGNYNNAEVLSIPEGYKATAGSISFGLVTANETDFFFYMLVGDQTFYVRKGVDDPAPEESPVGYFSLSRAMEKEMAVQVVGFKIKAYTVGIDLFCELTDEALAKWQLSVYDAIIRAYMNEDAAYEEKMRVKAIQNGPVQGLNPLFNEKIARDELKKLCLMILRNDSSMDFDGYNDEEGSEPTIDIDETCSQTSIIRFLENAFEWNNMLYTYYPYFWGRHSKWIGALHISDEDPEFESFLKAGAARVQVPVRPGFERAVAYFCQFGSPWLGNDPPINGDMMYVSIIEEITENLGGLEDGVPYPQDGEPWEVVVPTSLIVLQNLDEVPNIKDTLTENNIDIGATGD